MVWWYFMDASRRNSVATLRAVGNRLGSAIRLGMIAVSHSERGQAIVEFALVLPLVLLVTLFAIDVGRLVYTFSSISAAAREGARLVSTESQLYSDCAAIHLMEQVGQGFPLTMDPNSLAGDSDPNNPAAPLQPATPPRGAGYIYVWPAVSTATPQELHCDGAQRGGSQTIRHVAVQVQYNFVPLTPFLEQLMPTGLLVKTISVVQVEY